MKQLLVLAFVSISMICYGQGEVVDDYSQSGGIILDSTIIERYDLNTIAYLPYLTLNGNTLIGHEVLELGKTYTFTIEFTNSTDKTVKIANCILDCECLSPTWDNNTVAPGGKRNVTFTFHASTAGEIKAHIKVQYLDPLGTMPVAVQEGELTFTIGG